MPVSFSSQSEVGNWSVHCVGIVVEGGELNNSVPPGNSVPPDQHTQNDAWESGESLKDKAYRILSDKALITNLIDRVFDCGMLVHYLAHFNELASGRITAKNVAILFGLERAYWQTLVSTTNMTYDVITKKWYAVCQKLFGTSFLNMCIGEKNFGQVICKQSAKGSYDPAKGKINFAVPRHRHLVAVSKKFPKVIKPGLIAEGLDLIRNQTDLVLMIDCKKVARELEDNFCGDVQLFGYEEPNIKYLKRSLE